MLQQLFSRSLSVYPRIYLQFAALVGLLIAAEFSLSTLSMMLAQRAVQRISQGVRHRREVQRRVRCADTGGKCCA